MLEKEILEKFVLNNKDLEELESLLAQFNVFETLNIVNAEIRHSYILSWLLTPNANHGCGDYFVKLFLKYIFIANKEYIKSKLTIFDLEIFDYSDLEIRREWNNIDILIISEENKFVIAIENKILSFEHSNQLERYYNIIKKEFSGYENVFVYLTPEGEKSTEDSWVIFDYKTILSILEDMIEYKKSSISEVVYNFLRQYATIIRRYIVSNSEIERICRSIYKKHQPALDLIFQYKPDIEYEISEIVLECIKSVPDLIIDSAGKTAIRFTEKGLDVLIPKLGTGEWGRAQRILMFEFDNYGKRLMLRLYIGPGSEDLRNKLHSIAKGNSSLFNKSNRQLGQKWLALYQAEYLKSSDYEDGDIEVIRDRIKKKFSEFSSDELKKIVEHYANNWKD